MTCGIVAFASTTLVVGRETMLGKGEMAAVMV